MTWSFGIIYNRETIDSSINWYEEIQGLQFIKKSYRECWKGVLKYFTYKIFIWELSLTITFFPLGGKKGPLTLLYTVSDF